MNEPTIHSRRAFDGRLLKLDLLEVELENGRHARREIVRHPGAVAVWAMAPDGRYLFVRQFRKAIESALLEIVAGTLDLGETPAACALREIKEETGYAVHKLIPLGFIYPAPGFCGERLELFFAELSGQPAAPCLDQDELLRSELLSRQEFEALLAADEIHDAKTLVAWSLVQSKGLLETSATAERKHGATA